MKTRLFFLLKLYVAFLLIFVVGKPLFMLYNHSMIQGCGAGDWLQVMWHGLPLDLTMTGYFFVLPLLMTLASIWKPFNLRKFLLPYYIVVALFIAIIYVADMSLYEFWKFKLDSGIFFYLQTPGEAMASVSTGYILLRILYIVVLAALFTLLLYFATPLKWDTLFSTHKWLTTSIIILFMPVIFITIRGGVGESTANIGQVYYSDRQILNHSAVNPVFSLISSTLKVQDYNAQFNLFPEEEAARSFAALYPTLPDEGTPALLKTKRPNVLIIIWESFARYFTIEKVAGQEVTPQFNRMAREGLLFDNCYANSYRTDRGMVSILNGHLSYPTTTIMKIPAKSRTLPSIAQSLEQAGYSTHFLYGGDINFTNMQSYLRSTGYADITGQDDFSRTEQRTNAWGVNDDITYNRLYDLLTARQGGPWLTTFLTLSSHEPFVVPYHRLPDGMENAMAYSDDCLGKFIDMIKKSPLWDNLLVVVVADHGYHPAGSADSWKPIHFRVPVLWTGGAVAKSDTINTLMAQSDIAATLLAQLGLPHDKFLFSRNIASPAYHYPFAYYTFNNGFGFADSTGLTVYDNDAAKPLLKEPQSNDTLRIVHGKVILQKSYDDLGNR